MLFFRTFAVAMRKKLYLYALYSLFLLASCADKKPQQELTPWGTPVGEVEDMDGSDEEETDENAADGDAGAQQRGLSLSDIQDYERLRLLDELLLEPLLLDAFLPEAEPFLPFDLTTLRLPPPKRLKSFRR